MTLWTLAKWRVERPIGETTGTLRYAYGSDPTQQTVMSLPETPSPPQPFGDEPRA